MSHEFAAIAFTPAVRAMQERMGSRKHYAALDALTGPDGGGAGDAAVPNPAPLGAGEVAFIAGRDSFYLATVSQTGWPYVQHKGGPAGFLNVIDARTLAYADFRGNVQYVTDGNLAANDRVALILVDYAHRRRLKILGHAQLVDKADDPALLARLERPGYRARVERAVVITVAAVDWNCPQHITPRYTAAEIGAAASQHVCARSTGKAAGGGDSIP